MNDDSTRSELIAIPIVMVLFLVGIALYVAAARARHSVPVVHVELASA